jgi:hypothetical protein
MTLQPATRPSSDTTNLVEVLDRVLDKGLVVIGDISISVASVELLSLRIRLLVASLDRAEELGLDLSWAGIDPSRIRPAEEPPALGAPTQDRHLPAPEEEWALSSPPEEDRTEIATEQLERLHRRLARLERQLTKKTARKAAVHAAR